MRSSKDDALSRTAERALSTLEEITKQVAMYAQDLREELILTRNLYEQNIDQRILALQESLTASLAENRIYTESQQRAIENLSNELRHYFDRAFPFVGELGFDDPRHPVSLFRRMCVDAQTETAAYIREEMTCAVCELDHRSFLLKAVKLAPPIGDMLEFGVYKGLTINWLANACPDRTFFGFDSFRGLPTEWDGYKTFDFDVHGAIPDVPRNVVLVPGMFDQSLSEFVKEGRKIAFVHIDCDLYQSTKTVLKYVGQFLVPGAVLVFDEFFNYPGFAKHEMRALKEFLEPAKLKVEWLLYCGERTAGRIVASADQ